MAKRTFKLISLLLVLAFALTGCSMVEVDREMDDAEVIIKVNDTQLLKKDVMTITRPRFSISIRCTARSAIR